MPLSKMATTWDFLQPWCAVLAPYLSIRSPRTSAHNDVVITVDAGRFVGLEEEQYDRRIVQLREAVRLLSTALEVATQSEWSSIFRLCSGPENEDAWTSNSHARLRFRLSFRVSSRGDHPHALRLLVGLLNSPSSNSPSFNHAHAKILSLSQKSGGQVSFAVELHAPAKDNSGISFITAPSRTETLDYYGALQATMAQLQKPPSWMRVCKLDLNLAELETPPEVIGCIGSIVAANVPIGELAIQLTYTWDYFDHPKFVKVLKTAPDGTIDHLKIIATTRENYAAVMESIPLMTICSHMELEDRVLFGEMPPSLMSAFRRTFLSSTCWPTEWRSRKLTLRGLPFDEHTNKAGQSVGKHSDGPQHLVVHLASADLDRFMQYLPAFAASLEELEVHITDQQQCVASLAQIAHSCPRLQKLWVEGCVVDKLCDVFSSKRSSPPPWKMLKLTSAEFAEEGSLLALADALQQQDLEFTKSLVELAIIPVEALSAALVEQFERVLAVNKRLQRLTLGRVENTLYAKLLQYHHECLYLHCHALLSANVCSSMDTWNLRHIMDLADLSPRREIILMGIDQ